MKTISSSLQAHLNGTLTTLAYLIKIARADGGVQGFTTHDRDLNIDGVAYKADGALTPSAIESRAGLAVDNLEVTGFLDSDDVSDAAIAAGLYDFARVDVYMCNWADPTQGVVHLRRGWLGQVTRNGTTYVAELRGLHDLLQRPIGAYYTPECRFDLGDGACGIDLAAQAVSGTVTATTDRATFSDAALTAATDLFAYGKITWTSGANAGQITEIKAWNPVSKTFSLWLPMPNVIAVSDAYTATPGCDKRFSTCKSRFANGANFGGFPYVPGVGNLLQYPS